jgi:hypothetical protein
MGVSFEVVGSVADQSWIDEDLAAFADRLKASPWGGNGYDRLVVGDINASLRIGCSQPSTRNG